MSERQLKILLSELKTIRVTCKACLLIYEAPIDGLDRRFQFGKCPSCGAQIAEPGANNSLAALARAFQLAARDADRVGVEFVIGEGGQ